MPNKKSNPPMSFRPTKENRVRLEELVKRLDCDNQNATLNKIIENYSYYEKDKEALTHLRAIFRIMEEKK